MDKRWLRVGLAFHLGQEKFGDPAAVKGLFDEFKRAVGSSQKDFEQFVMSNNIEVDWRSDKWTSGGQVRSNAVVNFLLTTTAPASWIFVGRLLMPDKRTAASISDDSSKLDRVITNVLE